MHSRLLIALALAGALAGCQTQSALTGKAVNCRTASVDIVKSRYSREGSTTVWCAKCREKLFLCVSNPEHSRVECKEATPDLCS